MGRLGVLRTPKRVSLDGVGQGPTWLASIVFGYFVVPNYLEQKGEEISQ